MITRKRAKRPNLQSESSQDRTEHVREKQRSSASTARRSAASTPPAAKESAELWHALFQSMDQGACIVEIIFDRSHSPVDYRFLQTNPAFETHTGLKSVVGKTMRELAPEHEKHWFDTYGQVATTGEPVRFVNEAAQLNGRWFDVNAFRVGRPEERKVAIIFNDITQRRQSEEALRHTEAQRFALVEHSPVGMYLLDSNLRLLQVNSKAAPTLGNPGKLIGQSIDE
ncbi:MAG: PAS domain-containing protein, partial [Verrucomicrobiota bacterium]